EWGLLIICAGAVLAAEAFNTSIELLCDHLHPEKSEAIRNVKDMSAAAVLITSAAAFFTAFFLFISHFSTF
ncbi:MAG: diacylglycerol kinase, partial [Bacteroidia bacterium]